MKLKPKRITYNKISWFNQIYDGQECSFIDVKKTLYLLIAPINERVKTCSFCYQHNTNAYLVGRKGNTFKIRYCSDCKLSIIMDFKINRDTIPVKILNLIDLDWQINKEMIANVNKAK